MLRCRYEASHAGAHETSRAAYKLAGGDRAVDVPTWYGNDEEQTQVMVCRSKLVGEYGPLVCELPSGHPIPHVSSVVFFLEGVRFRGAQTWDSLGKGVTTLNPEGWQILRDFSYRGTIYSRGEGMPPVVMKKAIELCREKIIRWVDVAESPKLKPAKNLRLIRNGLMSVTVGFELPLRRAGAVARVYLEPGGEKIKRDELSARLIGEKFGAGSHRIEADGLVPGTTYTVFVEVSSEDASIASILEFKTLMVTSMGAMDALSRAEVRVSSGGWGLAGAASQPEPPQSEPDPEPEVIPQQGLIRPRRRVISE